MPETVVQGSNNRVLNSYTATRLSRNRWGITKAFGKIQKQQAANVFKANADKISAGKKLINTKNKYYREVDEILNEAYEYWRSSTRVYIEEGIRLVKNSELQNLQDRISFRSGILKDAVDEMVNHWDEVKNEAKDGLQDLFNPSDYPDDVAARYSIVLEPVNINPPDHLAELNPKLYEEQLRRRDERIQASLVLHDQLMAIEFHKLISHLNEVLSPGSDGKRKMFKSSSIDNVREFTSKFRQLSEGTDKELEELIDQAEKILSNSNGDGSYMPRTAEELRASDFLRNQVVSGMTDLQKNLDNLLVNPSRRAFSASVEEALKDVKEE